MRFNSVIFDVDSTLSGIEGIDWLANLRGNEVAEWSATLTDGTGVLLLLTPHGGSLIGGTDKPGKAAADPALLPASAQGSSPADPGPAPPIALGLNRELISASESSTRLAATSCAVWRYA